MKSLNKITSRLSGLLVVFICIFLIVSFVSRTVENPVFWVIESSQYALVAIIFLGFAICEEMKANVRVEVVICRLPKRLWQTANIFSYFVALVVVGMLLYGAFQDTLFSFLSKESVWALVAIPLWPAKFIIVIGIALYFIQLVINTVEEFKRPSPKPDEAEQVLVKSE